MPDWLFWAWIVLIIPTSFIGEGALAFLVVRLVVNSYFKPQDARDIEIAHLKTRVEELQVERDRLRNENGNLVIMLVERNQ